MQAIYDPDQLLGQSISCELMGWPGQLDQIYKMECIMTLSDMVHDYCSRLHNESKWCPRRVANAIMQQTGGQEMLTDADKVFMRNDVVLDLNYVDLLEEHLSTDEAFDNL